MRIRLPNRQLLAAGLIVVLAPIGTIIAAQTFDNFISQPQPMRVESQMPPVQPTQPMPPAQPIPPVQPTQPMPLNPDATPREGAPGGGAVPPAPQPAQPTTVALPEGLKAKCGTLEECKTYCGEHGDECRNLIRSDRTESSRTNVETRTCNINGREVPGPCPENAGGGQGVLQPSSSESRMGPNNGGPSEEEMQRREQEQRGQMLKDMKRNIGNMERGLAASTNGLKVCTAAKVAIPSELTQMVADARALIQKVKQATSPDEIEDVDFSIMPEIGDSVRELVDTCYRLREIPKITKQITSEVKRVERELKSLKTKADRAKLDLTEQFNATAQGIASVKETLASAAQAKTADDVDEAMENLQNVQQTFEDVHETLNTIRGVVDMQQGLRNAKNEIRDAERRITALKRKKVDVTELTVILVEAKATVTQIESLTKQKPLDINAIIETFDKLEDLRGRADDAFAKAEGRGSATPDLFGKSPAQNLKLDAFEQYRKPQETGGANLESLLGL